MGEPRVLRLRFTGPLAAWPCSELAIRPSPTHRLAPQQPQTAFAGDPAYRRRFCYSWRNACTGLILVALRAGSPLASNATIASIAATAANVTGSVAFTPNS